MSDLILTVTDEDVTTLQRALSEAAAAPTSDIAFSMGVHAWMSRIDKADTKRRERDAFLAHNPSLGVAVQIAKDRYETARLLNLEPTKEDKALWLLAAYLEMAHNVEETQ